MSVEDGLGREASAAAPWATAGAEAGAASRGCCTCGMIAEQGTKREHEETRRKGTGRRTRRGGEGRGRVREQQETETEARDAMRRN